MEFMVQLADRQERVRVRRQGALYEVRVGERVYQVDRVPLRGDLASLRFGDEQHEVSVHARGGGRYAVSGHHGLGHQVEVLEPLAFLARQEQHARGGMGPCRVTAYMPGRVVAVLVEEGAEVAAGKGVVVLEAMKMENEITAEVAGVIRRILVEPGQSVNGDDPLFEIEPVPAGG